MYLVPVCRCTFTVELGAVSEDASDVESDAVSDVESDAVSEVESDAVSSSSHWQTRANAASERRTKNSERILKSDVERDDQS